MRKNYVLTVLGKNWNQEHARSLFAEAASQGLLVKSGEVCPLAGSSLWMQRSWATASAELGAAELERLASCADAAGLDLFVEPEELFHTPRKLFVFDMDSTLIQAEVIDELAGLAGVKGEVSAITAAAMRGEIDFPTSLTRRVSLLRGIPENSIWKLTSQISLGEGLVNLVAGLKSAGCKTAILSGGFGFFGRHLQERLGFHDLYANELEISAGLLTGRLAAAIVDGNRKAEALREVAHREAICLQEVVAVGDGANDLPMLALAGTGVAYHAKPIVRAAASFRLNHCGLDALLHLLNRG